MKDRDEFDRVRDARMALALENRAKLEELRRLVAMVEDD